MKTSNLITPKTRGDIFDRISVDDLFDRVELPIEEKTAYSSAIQEVIQEEIRKALSDLPVAAMIKRAVEKMTEELEKLKKELSSERSFADLEKKREAEKHRKEMEELKEKLRKKYDELKTEVRSPKYTFGGFPLAGGGLPFADWRFIEDGSNLSVQKKVSGTWTEVFAFTPNS